MLEQTKNITIKGGPFIESTTLGLFPSRLNLLYGRNGSGKSTIARCVKRLGKEDEESGYYAETNPSLDEEQQHHIFVFEEDFVSSNFRMNETGLSSIVMLGKQVGLDERLQLLQDKRKQLKKEQANLIEKVQTFSNRFNHDSPLYHLNQIKKKLSADGGWAERDKLIKGNSIKSQVTDVLVFELMKLKPNMHYSVLRKDYDEKFRTLQQIKKGGSKIDLISNNVLFDNIDDVYSLMTRRVEEPNLGSRDKKLIEIVRSEYGSYLNQIHTVFDNPRMNVCPLCLRTIDNKDKEELFSKIKSFFNKDVEDYKASLQEVINSLLHWNTTVISDVVRDIIGQDTFEKFRETELELHNEYEQLLGAFNDRLQNVYGISSYNKWAEVKNAQDTYSAMLDKINKIIEHYNLEVAQKKKFILELVRINRLLVTYELKDNFVQYRQQKSKSDAYENEKNAVDQNLAKIDEAISDIMSEKAQVTIALDFINEALSYIFFNDKRLFLENVSGKYCLKSNGKDVKPGDVSTGERNAIALCYFFAKIFENHEKENRYKDEMLVVLDDPITSFDKENKVGIMTFLRWQVNEIYRGCNTSKVLIMSHDLMTIFNVQKLYKDIADKNFQVLELKNKQVLNLGIFRYQRNEYKKIIDEVFAIANGQSSDFLSIGNKMRRMEEAYSSFIFNGQFEKLLHNDDFLENVLDAKKVFFKNLMSRLILNTESHTEETVYDMEGFSQMFDKEEIRKTAKYLLMLFYYVDRFHLKSYLEGNFGIVEKWIEEDSNILN